MTDLRTRIAQAVCREYFDREDVVWQTWRESFNADPEYWCGYADAVLRELDDEFLDFGSWISEELRVAPMNRADLQSCLADWKAERKA